MKGEIPGWAAGRIGNSKAYDNQIGNYMALFIVIGLMFNLIYGNK
jgi:hypothetical protein